MRGLGVPFRVVAPEVDEYVSADTPPMHAVAILAEKKARAVFARNPTALVIGADQLVSFNGQAIGKAPDEATARRQLRSLRGKTHEILTGLCVVGPDFLATEVDSARLTVLPLSDVEVDAYLATGEWKGCAGGYRIEGVGQTIFSRIDGDRSSIQGLPMQRVVHSLREAGIRFF
jgi:septum formation protein